MIIAIVATLAASLWFGGLVRQARQVAKEHRHLVRQRSAKFTDALIGIKPIRAMGRTERFARVFENEARDLARSARLRILSAEYSADLQEPVIGAVLAIGFYLAVTKLSLEVHDLLIMSVLMIRTIAALLPMQRLAQQFIQTYDQYRSLSRLLKITEDAKEVSSGTLAPNLEQAVRLEEVSFAYGERPVLAGLDLTIPTGKITALVGPSGVGKSTRRRPAGGPLPARCRRRSGRRRRPARDRSRPQWRHRIGYVPQEVLLFHDTVRNNVTLYEDGVQPRR